MIETVIFDMDGVIIDSEPIHQEIQQTLFQQYNISITPGEYHTFIGRSSKNMWQELIEKHSLSVSVDEVLNNDKVLYHERLRNETALRPIPGIRELLNLLDKKGVTMVLASSSSMQSIELVLELLNLTGFFKYKISGANLIYSKPHPEIFEVAANMSNTVSSGCLVIEDSNHGVTAAKRANMKCVGYSNPNSGNQDLSQADLIIDDFYKLTWEDIQQLDGFQ
jgi:HAD superfamily hydrolase (TIGR01509 family)